MPSGGGDGKRVAISRACVTFVIVVVNETVRTFLAFTTSPIVSHFLVKVTRSMGWLEIYW